MREHYFFKYNAHVVNEKLYLAKSFETMLQQITHGAIQFLNKRKKLVQFALIFHLLSHNRPMIEYTIMETLFVQLNILDNPITHWFNGYGWQMADCMCKQVLKQTQTSIIGPSFLSLNAYEITNINN